MLALLEQLAGLTIIGVTLADIFLNVLYARAGMVIISRPLAHAVRALFVGLGRLFPKDHARILSFCGPAIVVILIVVWLSLLVMGVALLIHPGFSDGGIRATVRSPAPSADFITALSVAGGQAASVGPGAYDPVSRGYKLIFMVDGFMGISIVGLVITYLMQLYAALQVRDELALKVELYTRQTGDAARLVAGIFPEGRFETGYAQLTELAAELTRVKEAHHLYPILFYFRFPQALYELSRFTLVILDACALIRSCLEDEPAGWVKRSAGLEHLERGGLILIETLHGVYLRDEGVGPEIPDPEDAAAWRARFLRAVGILRAGGLPVRRDVSRCADRYIQLRNRWNKPLIRLGGAIGHEPQEIDPALYEPDPPAKPAGADAPNGQVH